MADHAFAVMTVLGNDAFVFATMTGEEALGRPYRFEALLLSENGEIDGSDLLGTAAGVEYTDPDGEARVFHGLVSGFGYAGVRDQKFAYRMELRPWLWFLGNRANCKIFQNVSIPDIVTDVFRTAGFTDFKDSTTGSYDTLEYCVQYNETDLDFCHRLMERAGLYYYFEHEKGRHQLVLIDSPTSHPDAGDITFQDSSVNQPVGNRITDWTTRMIPRPGGVSLESYTFTAPKSELKSTVEKPAGHAQDNGEVYLYAGTYEVAGAGEGLARTRLEAFAATHSRRLGQATAAAVATGYTFSLKEHPRQVENTAYLVVGARYRLVGHAYRSGSSDAGELFFQAEFEAMESDVPFRLAPETAIPRIPGPQTALVVGKSGEEIWTDKYGRVKIQFHWDLEGKKNEESSCWVRVAQRWAGATWGSQMLPRIGHEVIVDFINGDPDQPLVTGSVYNEDNKPAFSLPTNQTQSGVKTQTVKGKGKYNELRFEDKADSEEVYLRAQKDMTGEILNDLTMTVKNNETRTVEKDRTSTIKGKDSLTVEQSATTSVTQTFDMSAKQDMTLTSDSKITLKVGPSSIELSPSGITMKAPQVTIEGQSGLTAKSSGSVTVQGSSTTVKGISLTLSGDAMTTVKGGIVKIN